MNDLISIIVPVYNVDKYLNKCIDSIVNQTYKNLEIILINDGSTDNSGKICDEYANKDNRIKVIHKANGGISDARNKGLNIAKGEYIAFLDSDDCVEYDYIESLAKYADINTIVCCGYKRIKEKEVKVHAIKDILKLNRKYFFNQYLLFELSANSKGYINPIGNYMWNKLYPAWVFNNVRFPIGRTFEDIYISMKLFDKINNFVILPYAKYNYIANDNSIVARRSKKITLDSINARIEQEKYFVFNKNFLRMSRMLTLYSAIELFRLYSKGYYCLDNLEKNFLKNLIIKRRADVPLNHYKLCIKIWLLIYFEPLLKLIFNVYNRNK